MDKFNFIEITNFCNQKCLLKIEKKSHKKGKVTYNTGNWQEIVKHTLIFKKSQEKTNAEQKNG